MEFHTHKCCNMLYHINILMSIVINAINFINLLRTIDLMTLSKIGQ